MTVSGDGGQDDGGWGGGGGQVMGCSFAHGDAFFSRERLARGGGLAPYAGKERDRSMRKEEGAIVTSATAAQCADEGGGMVGGVYFQKCRP